MSFFIVGMVLNIMQFSFIVAILLFTCNSVHAQSSTNVSHLTLDLMITDFISKKIKEDEFTRSVLPRERELLNLYNQINTYLSSHPKLDPTTCTLIDASEKSESRKCATIADASAYLSQIGEHATVLSDKSVGEFAYNVRWRYWHNTKLEEPCTAGKKFKNDVYSIDDIKAAFNDEFERGYTLESISINSTEIATIGISTNQLIGFLKNKFGISDKKITIDANMNVAMRPIFVRKRKLVTQTWIESTEGPRSDYDITLQYQLVKLSCAVKK